MLPTVKSEFAKCHRIAAEPAAIPCRVAENSSEAVFGGFRRGMSYGEPV
jgi:hypothetical protein